MKWKQGQKDLPPIEFKNVLQHNIVPSYNVPTKFFIFICVLLLKIVLYIVHLLSLILN